MRRIGKDEVSVMNVQITITGTQTLDGASETTRLSATGRMERDGDAWVPTYAESAESGMDGVTTQIRAGRDRAEIRRSGALNSRLLLEEGGRHLCRYDTGYGFLQLGVHTHRVENRLEEGSGQLRLHYTLELEGGAAARQELLLEVARPEGAPDKD